MTVTYIEKGPGMLAAIAAAGHRIWHAGQTCYSSNDAAVQAIINSYDPLPDQKAARIALIKADGLARINAVFPAIVSVDEIKFFAEFWASIIVASRSATAPFQKVIDIYTAAKNAIASVNACTTKAQIDAVTVSWPP